MKNIALRKHLILLQSILVMMLVQMGTDIYLPSIPVMMTSLGTTAFLLKLSITVMIIGLGVSQLYYGPLADYMGRRKVILLGMALFIVGSIFTVVAPSVAYFLLGRLIQGLALGFGLSFCVVVTSDLYEGSSCQQVLSIISILYAVMPVVAPMIGGVLQTYIGWRANLWVLLLAAILMFGMLWFYFPETKKNLQASRFHFSTVLTDYFTCVKNGLFAANLLIGAFFYAGEVAYIIQLPLIAQWQFAMDPITIGSLIIFTSFALVVGSGLSAFLAKRWHPNKIIYVGVSSAFIGMGVWLLILWFNAYSLFTLIGPMTLFMLGSGLAFPNCIANCLKLFPQIAGAVSALSVGAVTAMGGLLTFIVAKMPTSNPFALPMFMFGLSLCLAICALVIARQENISKWSEMRV